MSTTSTSSGWNRSTSTPKPAPKKPSAMRGVVAGLVVVALAVVCAVVFMGKGEKPVEKVEKERGRIKEVTPAKAPTNTVAVKKQEPSVPKTKPTKPFEVVNGMTMLSNGELWPTNRIKVYKPKGLRHPREFIFDNRTDNELAALMFLKPGESLVGGPMHHKDYKKDFLEVIKKPIEILPTDSEEDKQIKLAVIDARKELKAAVDRGEDPAAIIKETYESSQKLAIYKEQVLKQVREVARENPNISDSDMDDLINASNQMLESKGIAPMKFNAFARARMRMGCREAIQKVIRDKEKLREQNKEVQ